MIAIVGGKGGCGKTTTSVGLGRALARRGDRVIVADADCDMPNLHTVTETPYSPGLGALDDGASPARVIHESPRFPGLRVVPSGSLTGATTPELLAALHRLRDRVILDCPAGATTGVTAPLAAADAAIVVSTAEQASLVDAVKTARMVRSVGTPLLGSVVTRAPPDFDPGQTPLHSECSVLAVVPEHPGASTHEHITHMAYARLAEGVAERKI